MYMLTILLALKLVQLGLICLYISIYRYIHTQKNMNICIHAYTIIDMNTSIYLYICSPSSSRSSSSSLASISGSMKSAMFLPSMISDKRKNKTTVS